MKKFKYSKQKASALILVVFISAIALFITTTILNSSEKNTDRITDERSGKLAYYAAEAGIEKLVNLYNSDSSNWGLGLSNLDLPTSESPTSLNNNASYWIDSIEYIDSNSTALISAIGNHGSSFRKIRVRITLKIPDIYDDYGLLTNGTITVHGNKTLEMSIHGNGGLSLTGPTDTTNNAMATQSSDSSEDAPDPTDNPVGGYVPEVDVPTIPMNKLKTEALTNGTSIDVTGLTQEEIYQQISDAPTKYIYIGTGLANLRNQAVQFAHNSNKIKGAVLIPTYYFNHNPQLVKKPSGGISDITLYGDMQGKVIFIDSDITINANGINDLSNVMVVSAGSLTVNGSVDIGTSHAGKVDTTFACQDEITLNGSRDFNALFWTNSSFRQNGSSMAGRVIAQTGITFNGNFTLSRSDSLYDNGAFDRIAIISSKQQIAMD